VTKKTAFKWVFRHASRACMMLFESGTSIKALAIGVVSYFYESYASNLGSFWILSSKLISLSENLKLC